MPRKKTTKKESKAVKSSAKKLPVVEKAVETNEYAAMLSDRLKWGESYISLLLGILVVVIVALLFVTFIKGRNAMGPSIKQDISSQSVSPTVVPQKKAETDTTGKIIGDRYTVKEGDLLWDVAVRAYGDGFKWTTIAEANNLPNPDAITNGMVLKIPR